MNDNKLATNNQRIKIPQPVIARTPGLLPMLYKIRELAEDLDVPYRTMWDWLKFGLPYQTDARGHIWIKGEDFKQWVADNRKRSKSKLASGEAYCFRCGPVKPENPEIVPMQGKLYHLRGTCPVCGSPVSRGGSSDQ